MPELTRRCRCCGTRIRETAPLADHCQACHEAQCAMGEEIGNACHATGTDRRALREAARLLEDGGPVRLDCEAVRYDGSNGDAVRRWMYTHVRQTGHPAVWFDDGVLNGAAYARVYDHLSRRWQAVRAGEWVARGPRGEHFPMDEEEVVRRG